MFDEMNTPPKSMEDMRRNSQARKELSTMLLNLMIENEENPIKKLQMNIPKKCAAIMDKLSWFMDNYADILNEDVNVEDVKSALEYLELVGIGIDNYIVTKKGESNG